MQTIAAASAAPRRFRAPVQAAGQQPDRVHRDDRHVPGDPGISAAAALSRRLARHRLVAFAAALNCLVERTVDALMARTSWRATARGDISPLETVSLAMLLGAAGLWLLHCFINDLTMWLTLATSGTAPANWLPAVIEASQSGDPLILLSADRPPELQDCGANQTIDQRALFGVHVRASHLQGTPSEGFDPAYLQHRAAQVCEQATWPHPGPAHVNQPFREPLVPSGDTPPDTTIQKIYVSRPALHPDPAAIAALAAAISGRPGIIVCGEIPGEPGFADAVAALAARLDSPILAEPLSNLRFGPHDRSHLCVRYNTWLDDTQAARDVQPDWILRFGAFPVTRKLQQLLGGAPAIHALVEPWPRGSDPQHKVTHLLRADPLAACQALLATAPHPAQPGWHAGFARREADAVGAPPGHVASLLGELPAARRSSSAIRWPSGNSTAILGALPDP